MPECCQCLAYRANGQLSPAGGGLKTRDRKTRHSQNCRTGERKTGKRGTKLQDWKTREKAYMESQTCYNFDTHVWIFIFFGRNVTDKVGNQQTLYYATLSNLCFRTTWQNAETRKSYFTQLDCVTHNAPVRYLSERKNVICDEFDSV